MSNPLIGSLFEYEIRRPIEEVVKVAQADVEVVREEIREYVPTEAIQKAYELVLQRMNDGIAEPTEAIGIWISGFFGTGKSSFAKILGYLLEQRTLGSDNASELFTARIPGNNKLKDLIELLNRRLAVTAIIFDISECLFVRTASEPIREVMYRAFLDKLGYSDDIDVAELEISFEARGLLESFKDRYLARYKRTWDDGRRDRSFVFAEASAILHEMDRGVYPSPDSWYLNRKPVNMEVEQFVERCFDLMARRRPKDTLVFVIDEVGQYVSRSVDKMLDLQGVVQAFARVGRNRAKAGGKQAWIAVTAQEKLDEVVDALGQRKIELARLQARFATQIDLMPANISEVAAQRVLRKTPEGEKLLGSVYDSNRGRLSTLLSLQGSSRDSTITKNSFVRLYPFPPHFIDLSLDIVTGIRLQPGAMRHIGGSNRTIIKQAQQALIHPDVALAKKPLGTLVTLDMLFDLLRPSISNERWRDIHDIEERIDPNAPLASKVAKAITMLEFVRDLRRTPENISATLLPKVDAEPVLADVRAALELLERHQFVRLDTDTGYKLQSSQEKAWARERDDIECKPKARRELLAGALAGLFQNAPLRTYRLLGIRTLKLGYMWDEQRLGDAGDVAVRMVAADKGGDAAAAVARARALSDQGADPLSLYWTLSLDDRSEGLARDLFQSREIVRRRHHLQATGTIPKEEIPLLLEENARCDRLENDVRSALSSGLRAGKGFFRAVEYDLASLGETLGEIGQAFFSRTIPELYPKLPMAARVVTGKEVEKLLSASSLAGLPSIFSEGPDGLALVEKQGDKWVINAQAPTAKEVMTAIRDRHAYGERVDGRFLEGRFTTIPYGWDPDVLRIVLGALVRGGVIEVVSAGRRLRRPEDPALREVFAKVPAFRGASFSPRETLELKTLAAAATNLEGITGDEVEIDEEAIARGVQHLARNRRDRIAPVLATLRALDLPGQESMADLKASLEGLLDAPPDDCVRTIAEDGRDLGEQLRWAGQMERVLDEEGLATLRRARRAEGKGALLDPARREDEAVSRSLRRLSEHLAAESFAERLPDIAADATLIEQVYSRQYLERHAHRTALYAAAIDRVRGLPGWEGVAGPEAVLAPLTARACPSTDPAAPDECPICGASLDRIEHDIDSVGYWESSVLQAAREAIDPPQVVERVSIIDFLPPAALESEESLETAITRLRDHLRRLIREGKRFRLEM